MESLPQFEVSPGALQPARTRPTDRRVLTVVTFMENNLHHQNMAKEIAHSVNLSYSRVRHLFVKEMGVSPMHYLKTLRMQKARQLLESTFLSVKEIATQVGLTDESHFVKDFKKTNGSTPGKYRQVHYLNGING